MKHFILATAGHVDHGKSTLVKALTGTDPDRLPEEKARGITIELGFAELALPDARLGIVDVPGHEAFVKNMVAGVGSIDLAVLVVAADDGWMPQTEEHVQILTYLGVKHAVVALTKTDLVDSVEAAELDVREQLAGTPFANAPIVRTSVTTGGGLDELQEQLAAICASLAPQRDIGKPRLAVDRTFNLHGVGPVVTGTLTGGTLHRGDSVVVQPRGIVARVRGLQSHNRSQEAIGPGTRTALNLPDLEVGRDVRRGDVITLPSLGSASGSIDVLLSRSPRLPANTRALKHGSRVIVHHGTTKTVARVLLRDADELAAGDSAVAQLRLEQPLFAFVSDRFVLRDSSEQRTLAGGVILDLEAGRAAQREFLERRAAAPDSLEVLVATQLQRERVVRRSELLLQSPFSAEEISAALARVAALLRGEMIVAADWWTELCESAKRMIDQEHAAHPNILGLDVTRLREVCGRADVCELLVAELCANGFVRRGDKIARAGRRPVLPPAFAGAGERIRAALAAKPFDPPSVRELTIDTDSRQALRCLRDAGELVELNQDVLLPNEQLTKAREAIVAFVRRNGGATVSELRQLLGSSRRVMVPLLERLDREGVTRRVGDKRVLR